MSDCTCFGGGGGCGCSIDLWRSDSRIAVWCSFPSLTTLAATAATAMAAAAVSLARVMVHGNAARADTNTNPHRIWKAIVRITSECACACGDAGAICCCAVPIPAAGLRMRRLLAQSLHEWDAWHRVLQYIILYSFLALGLSCEWLIESVLSADQPADPVIANYWLVFSHVLLIPNAHSLF